MNYFELYPGDYLRDTARLGLADHGAYLKLMLAYYSEEKPLPADLPSLYQIASAITASDKAAVRKVVDLFFPVAADGLRHKNRIDEEIAKAQKRIATAKANGAKNQPKKNPAGHPAGMPDDTQRHTHSGEALHTPHATTPTGESNQPPAVGDALGYFEGHEYPEMPQRTPAADMAIALTSAGFACTSLNPDLIAYAEAGGTREHLLEIAANPDCRGKKATYAIRFAHRELATKAEPVVVGTPRNVAPSRQLAGVASILGVTHERPDPRTDLVLAGDPEWTGEPVRALPGRHTGG